MSATVISPIRLSKKECRSYNICITCRKVPAVSTNTECRCDRCFKKNISKGVTWRARRDARICNRCKAPLTADENNHCTKCRDKKLKKAKDDCKLLKDAAFAAYGGYKCRCCGSEYDLQLQLDHINNDGAAYRRAVGKGGNWQYRWLKENNYPKDLLQPLCGGCHGAKTLSGSCDCHSHHKVVPIKEYEALLAYKEQALAWQKLTSKLIK